MPEYIVRTRPGTTTTRVQRPGGTTRVRTRLAAGGGGGGVSAHNLLSGRSADDAHPISAITGLQAALDAAVGGGSEEVANVSSVISFDLDGAFTPDDPVAFPPGFILAVVNQNTYPEWDGIYEGQADPSPAPMVRVGDLPDTLMWSSYRVTQPSEVVAPLPGGLWAEDDGVWFFVSGRTLADLTDVDVVSDPPAQDDVLAWDDTAEKWTPATLDGGVALSNTAPQDLGTAAAGVSTEASRADHVHAMPTAADVGADPAGTAAGLVDDLSGVTNQSAARSNLGLGTAATADTGTGSSNVILGNDARLTDARTPNVGGSNDDFMQRKAGAWTNRTVAQVRTDLGVARGGILDHGQNALPSGRYISNSLAQASTAQNFTPNNLWFCPFVPPFDVTIDRLCVEVTTQGAASSLGRIGIYAVTNGVPAALIRDAGTFDGSTLGVKELTLDPTVTLSGGTNYAFAFFHNSGSNMAMRVFSFIGAMQLSEAAAGGNVTSPRRTWTRSLTFSTLPDPAGTVTHETVLPVAFYMRGV